MSTEANNIIDAMAGDTPYARYRKTVLGRVYVSRLNPFSGEPEPFIMKGDPNKPEDDETSTVATWDQRGDLFFNRINQKHFIDGRLSKLADPVLVRPVSPNELSDEEVSELLTKPFLAMKNRLKTFTTTAPVFRVLTKAEAMDKSERYIKHIRERLAELQAVEFGEVAEEKE